MNRLVRLVMVCVLTVLVGAEGMVALASSREVVRDARVDERIRGAGIERASFRDDEIIVKFDGGEIARRIPVRGSSVEEALAEYRSRGDVLYAEPNYIAEAFFVPNDPYYAYQWNFDNDVHGGVRAESAWEVSRGQGVVVAVIDTGVAYEQYRQNFSVRYYQAPDLAGTTFVSGYDLVGNDVHANDDNGHGTHVAGTIAGTTGNALGVAGLAHGASIMPIKVLDRNGSGTYFDIADGVRFAADNGAKVINLSLGGPTGATYLEEALAYAYQKGVTIVAASGNNGSGSVSYPAAYDAYVIAVGATRFDGTRAPYSNYGSSLDLVAPGGDTSVDQNGDGQPDGILQQTGPGTSASFDYYFYQGTSMATPHVAAAAAMLIAHGITNPDDVRARLERTARDLGERGKDSVYGAGLLDIAAALGAGSEESVPVNAPPSVTLTAPEAGAVLSGAVSLSADASDDVGVDRVEFFFGNTLLASDTSAPYTHSFDTTSVANGSSSVRVIAYDGGGLSAADDAGVIVNNTPVPVPEVVVFSESFESSFSPQWSQDSQNDWYVSSQRAFDSGTRSAEIDGRASNAALTSISIPLQGRSNVRINFGWLIERTLDSNEYLAFDVSTNGGSSWVERGRVRGNVDSEDVWHRHETTLTNISSLRIRFRGLMSDNTEDANVDALTVTAF